MPGEVAVHPVTAPVKATGVALQAVLFDMDGLLVDTENAWGVAEREVMAWLGHPAWTAQDAAAMVGGPLAHVAEIMVERSGSDLAPCVVEQRLVDTMARLLAGGAQHRPGAPELLDDLAAHGVPCALVSSSPRSLVDAVLHDVGGEHFRATIAGDEVPRTKPFPDPYLLACERLGVEPARAVVLEDSPVGVTAAEAAGCVVVAVPFAVPIEPAPRRHVVSSLHELDTGTLIALVAADLAAT
jgi:HAD superfamily hydrolase (TIGR01509 family)